VYISHQSCSLYPETKDLNLQNTKVQKDLIWRTQVSTRWLRVTPNSERPQFQARDPCAKAWRPTSSKRKPSLTRKRKKTLRSSKRRSKMGSSRSSPSRKRTRLLQSQISLDLEKLSRRLKLPNKTENWLKTALFSWVWLSSRKSRLRRWRKRDSKSFKNLLQKL